MNSRQTSRRSLHLLLPALVIASAGALAAEPPATSTAAPTQDRRVKMAVMHEQMAACLRSDKPFAQCRQEMMQQCQAMMGQQCMNMGADMGMGMAPQKP
jgi:hypothetical protein